MRFHDFRHTCAPLLLKERARPKEVQSLLGHKTIAMTVNDYGHFVPGMGKDTADTMERALAQNRCRKDVKEDQAVPMRGRTIGVYSAKRGLP